MIRLPLLAGLASAILFSLAFAAGPPSPSLKTVPFRQLIDRLGDRDYRTREMAERRLHAAGALALPHLRKALGHRDPEVRRRALRLFSRLERALLFAPRRITLSIERQPLNQVIEQLSKASGYKIVNYAGGPQPGKEANYSYKWNNVTFWEAIEQLCQGANLHVQTSYSDDTVRLSRSSSPQPYVGSSGPFRYAATSFQLYRNVNLTPSTPGSTSSRSENLTFAFTIFSEPRFPIVGTGAVRLEAAYDDLRNSMLIRTNPTSNTMSRSYYGGSSRRYSTSVSVALARPSPTARRMKLIRGVVPVTLVVKQTPITLSDKILSAKGAKKTVEEVEFLIQDVKKVNNNQLQVVLSATSKGSDSSWRNGLYSRLALYDDKGNKFTSYSTSWSTSTNNSARLSLTYSNSGGRKISEASKLVYTHWRTAPHDVEFEFRNIPLP